MHSNSQSMESPPSLIPLHNLFSQIPNRRRGGAERGDGYRRTRRRRLPHQEQPALHRGPLWCVIAAFARVAPFPSVPAWAVLFRLAVRWRPGDEAFAHRQKHRWPAAKLGRDHVQLTGNSGHTQVRTEWLIQCAFYGGLDLKKLLNIFVFRITEHVWRNWGD